MSLIPTPLSALKVFDLVPGYIYAAALAIVLIGGGVTLGWQHIEIAGLEKTVATKDTKIAEQQRDAETLRATREQMAREYGEHVAAMQQEHAKKQQEIVDGYQQKILALTASRDAERARADRVQQSSGAAAASDRQAAAGNGPACQRVADHNAILYELVSEGFSLAAEGRRILGERDAQVDALKSIITNDRAAICGGKETQ